jgi:NADH dehydrogenase [ubiquinone] 1 alpha subcomplex assembly factor 3
MIVTCHGEKAELTSTDLLIIGTGPRMAPIAPAVRKYLNNLGIRLEVQDTRNAAAQFNLLATERGVGQVAAAMIPVGWREGR